MPLINWKTELKLTDSNANDDANSNNIIFTIKDTKLYVPVVTLSAKGNQNLLKLLSKGFERSVYWNEYKTKSEMKNVTNEYRYFLESNFVGVNRLFLLVYSIQGENAKRYKAQRYYLPKGAIKNYNVIINGNNFYYQPIDSDIKRSKEIRNLTTGQVKIILQDVCWIVITSKIAIA